MRGDLWKPQIQGLKGAHQRLWYDHRGLGESAPSPRFPWNMTDMSRDALGVMDAAGWSSDVHLVGVSMGGMIAQEMALACPERFLSLTLIATHPGGHPGFTIPPLRGLKAFIGSQLRRGDARLKALQQILYPPEYAAQTDQEGLAERVRLQLGRPVPLKTRLAHMYAVGLHRTGKRLKSLSLPTLILKPGRDILVNAKGSDALESLIPQTELRFFEEAGHGLIFQCAADVNQAVVEHVKHHQSTVAQP